MHPVDELRAALPAVEPYPPGMIPVPTQIVGTAFFPGGTGLWNPAGTATLGTWPRRGVLVLGQDFDSEQGYLASRAAGCEVGRSATWRALLPVLAEAAIPLESCFFTNAYMGLRDGSRATGPNPGSSDRGFVDRCRAFFLHQVRLQAPSVVIALGHATPRFLATLAPELTAWKDCRDFNAVDGAGPMVTSVHFPDTPPCTIVSLTHPSFRALNVKRRRFEALVGNDAERTMLQRAWRPHS